MCHRPHVGAYGPIPAHMGPGPCGSWPQGDPRAVGRWFMGPGGIPGPMVYGGGIPWPREHGLSQY